MRWFAPCRKRKYLPRCRCAHQPLPDAWRDSTSDVPFTLYRTGDNSSDREWDWRVKHYYWWGAVPDHHAAAAAKGVPVAARVD
jgi:hypothetical protein